MSKLFQVVAHGKALQFNCSHDSMQFSDSPSQMAHDAHTIFARAFQRRELWVTGTEAGQAVLRGILHNAANDHGYAFYVNGDCWVAVRRADMKHGSTLHGYDQFLSSSDGVGKHTGRGVTWTSWDSDSLGCRVTVGVSHYLTKGRNPKDPNYDENSEMARGIGDWAQEHGKGHDLVFFAADSNIVDKIADVFRGEDLTTMWDELGKWENTGHGNIDVIATYNRDHRVKAIAINAMRDNEFKLNTDHYRVEATLEVANHA